MKYYIKINRVSNNIYFTNKRQSVGITTYFGPSLSALKNKKQGPINSVTYTTSFLCFFSLVWGTGLGLELTPWVLTSICYWRRGQSSWGCRLKWYLFPRLKNREMFKTMWWYFVIKISTSHGVIVFFIIIIFI